MKKLVRNAIRCKHCGDVIESKRRHDYHECSCGTVSVDGGLSYLRRGFKTSPEEDFEDLCEFIDAPGFHVEYIHRRYGGWPRERPYEVDLTKSQEEIFRNWSQDDYYIRITDEDGKVVFDNFPVE